MTNQSASRNIIILSSEAWGIMLISKMHFANELVKNGDKVFFVNPPRASKNNSLAEIAISRENGNLNIVDLNIVKGSVFFRHKFPFLYSLINRRYIKALKKIVGADIQEVWCFNPNLFTDLRPFKAEKSGLFLYDFYRGNHVIKAALSADRIISVSQVILDHYQSVAKPSLLVQHGLGHAFAELAVARLKKQDFPASIGGKIKVGYTGNLLRAGMNVDIARTIINEHPDVEFHFWGPHSPQNNNVSGPDLEIPAELSSFVSFLQQQQNVILHGTVGQSELAESLFGMDALLFIYSPKKEMNGASNAHKLIEYLSTGKAVIATHVSNYAGTGLLEMTDKEGENDLPGLFHEVINNLPAYNAKEKQELRIKFALDNTYSRQTERIQKFIAQ